MSEQQYPNRATPDMTAAAAAELEILLRDQRARTARIAAQNHSGGVITASEIKSAYYSSLPPSPGEDWIKDYWKQLSEMKKARKAILKTFLGITFAFEFVSIMAFLIASGRDSISIWVALFTPLIFILPLWWMWHSNIKSIAPDRYSSDLVRHQALLHLATPEAILQKRHLSGYGDPTHLENQLKFLGKWENVEKQVQALSSITSGAPSSESLGPIGNQISSLINTPLVDADLRSQIFEALRIRNKLARANTVSPEDINHGMMLLKVIENRLDDMIHRVK